MQRRCKPKGPGTYLCKVRATYTRLAATRGSWFLSRTGHHRRHRQRTRSSAPLKGRLSARRSESSQTTHPDAPVSFALALYFVVYTYITPPHPQTSATKSCSVHADSLYLFSFTPLLYMPFIRPTLAVHYSRCSLSSLFFSNRNAKIFVPALTSFEIIIFFFFSLSSCTTILYTWLPTNNNKKKRKKCNFFS